LQQGCISNHNQESEQLLKCGKRGEQRVDARRDIDHMMLSRRVSTKIDHVLRTKLPATNHFWTELVLSFYEDSHPKSLSMRLFCLLRTLVCPNDLVPTPGRPTGTGAGYLRRFTKILIMMPAAYSFNFRGIPTHARMECFSCALRRALGGSSLTVGLTSVRRKVPHHL
jgi:hypothetical protein